MKAKAIILLLTTSLIGCATQSNQYIPRKNAGYNYQQLNKEKHRSILDNSSDSTYQHIIHNRKKFIQRTNPNGFPPL